MKCRNITFGCRGRYAVRWKEGNADEKDDTRYDRSARSLLLELRQIAPFFNAGAIETTMYDSISNYELLSIFPFSPGLHLTKGKTKNNNFHMPDTQVRFLLLLLSFVAISISLEFYYFLYLRGKRKRRSWKILRDNNRRLLYIIQSEISRHCINIFFSRPFPRNESNLVLRTWPRESCRCFWPMGILTLDSRINCPGSGRGFPRAKTMSETSLVSLSGWNKITRFRSSKDEKALTGEELVNQQKILFFDSLLPFLSPSSILAKRWTVWQIDADKRWVRKCHRGYSLKLCQ